MWKNWSLGLAIAGLALLVSTSLAIAQFDSPAPRAERPAGLLDDVPAAALLTQRGQELAERLRQLRRIEATMGAKHPSRSEVQDEIEAVLEQLQAWSPAVRSTSTGTSLPDALPAMNEHDLHQLILRLSTKVEQLESRVAALEKQATNARENH